MYFRTNKKLAMVFFFEEYIIRESTEEEFSSASAERIPILLLLLSFATHIKSMYKSISSLASFSSCKQQSTPQP